MGGPPVGSETDVALLLQNWEAGLSHSPGEEQGLQVRQALITFRAMQSGVHFPILSQRPWDANF